MECNFDERLLRLHLPVRKNKRYGSPLPIFANYFENMMIISRKKAKHLGCLCP